MNQVERTMGWMDPFLHEIFEAGKKFSHSNETVEKVAIIVATLFAALLTLPLAGIGGAFAFRFLVEKMLGEEVCNREQTRRINSLNPNNLPSPQQSSQDSQDSGTNSCSPSALPQLPIKIGGFSNGGNTCFIASALQVLRQIPMFIQHLSPAYTLHQMENESAEAFGLRNQIKKTVAQFMDKTSMGDNISASEIKAFHKLLFNYKKVEGYLYNIPVGHSGDALETLRDLLTVVEIAEKGKCMSKNYCFTYHYKWQPAVYDLKAQFTILEEHIKKTEAQEIVYNPSIVCIRNWTLLKNQPKQVLVVPSSSGKEVYKYVLAAVTYIPNGIQSGHHTFAYLRDPYSSTTSWIRCNDQNTQDKFGEIPNPEFVDGLIYIKQYT